MTEKIIPRRKIDKAYGNRENCNVISRRIKAKMAHSILSAQLGDDNPRGWRRELPADNTKERPAPTWMPLTTGVGITRLNHLSKPERLKISTTPETKKPAETV
jgi:hypothetical protein